CPPDKSRIKGIQVAREHEKCSFSSFGAIRGILTRQEPQAGQREESRAGLMHNAECIMQN
nr:hypothetical protein [Clostridia bacterium]